MAIKLFGRFDENATVGEVRDFIINNPKELKPARKKVHGKMNSFDLVIAVFMYADNNQYASEHKYADKYASAVGSNSSRFWKDLADGCGLTDPPPPDSTWGKKNVIKYFSKSQILTFEPQKTVQDVRDYYAANPNKFFQSKEKKLDFLSIFDASSYSNTSSSQTNNNGDEKNLEQKIKDLIINHGIRQIIFTGAPGTGKTRSAKSIAKEIGAEHKLVQFHPSYDYTDFVEGLRPVGNNSGNNQNSTISFVKLDGSFKAFCRKVAEKNYKYNQGNNNNNNNNNAPENDEENNKNAEGTKEMYKNDPDRLYFFIVDEINRADLSKVFGELMFCLEKDKRGEKVDTQYQNLPTYDLKGTPLQNDAFADGFFIPKNIVLIGTMNDIDRSVESMDFALRRRFEWVEFLVTKETLKEAFDKMPDIPNSETEKIAEKVAAMNSVMTKPEYADLGLNRHYFISQGQFANLPDDLNDKEAILKYAWEYRIESLLREYLRGIDETRIDKFIKACEASLEVYDEDYN